MPVLDYTHRCQYCDSRFTTPPPGGKCPYCAGPGVRLIEQKSMPTERVEIVFDRYHAPITRNPIRQAKRWAFRTLGFWVTAPIALMITLFIAWQLIYWLIFVGPASPLTDPKLQYEIATPMAPILDRVPDSWWRSVEWLSQSEARDLRTKPNVANLAFLENGGAKYSKLFSVESSESAPWVRGKPFGMTTLAVTGTSVTFEHSGFTYTLNVYQPFVFRESDSVVYFVNAKGEIWHAEKTSIALKPIEEAKVPQPLAPNANLSFTH